jgi:hypothetical protein
VPTVFCFKKFEYMEKLEQVSLLITTNRNLQHASIALEQDDNASSLLFPYLIGGYLQARASGLPPTGRICVRAGRILWARRTGRTTQRRRDSGQFDDRSRKSFLHILSSARYVVAPLFYALPFCCTVLSTLISSLTLFVLLQIATSADISHRKQKGG